MTLTTALDPRTWAARLPAPPVSDATLGGPIPLVIRHWRGIDSNIDQAALDQHYVSLHLGGAKRLVRRGEGAAATAVAKLGSYSVVPAGASYRWTTHGPIDFVHFYLPPVVVNELTGHGGQGSGGGTLRETLGRHDALVHNVCLALLEAAKEDGAQQAYLDHLAQLLVLRVLRNQDSDGPIARIRSDALAPHRLRRVTEWIEAHLDGSIGVADMAAVAGLSPFHFSRAFKASTGMAPYAYVLDARIEHAKGLLRDDRVPLDAVGKACGFDKPHSFAKAFRRIAGCPPSRWRS